MTGQSWEQKLCSGDIQRKSNENKEGGPLEQNDRKLVKTGGNIFFEKRKARRERKNTSSCF